MAVRLRRNGHHQLVYTAPVTCSSRSPNTSSEIDIAYASGLDGMQQCQRVSGSIGSGVLAKEMWEMAGVAYGASSAGPRQSATQLPNRLS